MSTNEIADLNLHDSVITCIKVIRSGTNIDDTDFHLKYVEDYDTMEMSNKILRFSGCYKLTMDVNFGCASPDSILSAVTVSPSEVLTKIVEGFEQKANEPFSFSLKHYRIETSTTSSRVDIVAREMHLLDGTDSNS
jgi:hypothetical protein